MTDWMAVLDQWEQDLQSAENYLGDVNEEYRADQLFQLPENIEPLPEALRSRAEKIFAKSHAVEKKINDKAVEIYPQLVDMIRSRDSQRANNKASNTGSMVDTQG